MIPVPEETRGLLTPASPVSDQLSDYRVTDRCS